MKRHVNASGEKIIKDKPLSVNDVPDISNRYIDAETLFAWLDKLVEVKKHEEDICNN